MQEARGTAVQAGEPTRIVAGVGGGGARGVHGARAGQGGAAGQGRGRGALAGAVVLNHQVLDAVHRRVEGEVPAAGARRAPCAQRIGAERPAEAAGAAPASSVRSSERSWGAPASEAQGGRYILSVAAEDLALRVSWGQSRRRVRWSPEPALPEFDSPLSPPSHQGMPAFPETTEVFPDPAPSSLVLSSLSVAKMDKTAAALPCPSRSFPVFFSS